MKEHEENDLMRKQEEIFEKIAQYLEEERQLTPGERIRFLETIREGRRS